jgi:predicted nuclease of predicted toxin-antitoxin system
VKFFLDHDVPAEVEHLLKYWQHEVTKLQDALPITTPDEEVFRFAQRNALIIVSCNRGDFLELAKKAFAEKQQFSGLVILIRRRTRQLECAHLLSLLRRAGESGVMGNINLA